jgi:dTDP-L-rhamnose 4-epimerase
MSELSCVVTGGAGFIGCALSAGLVRRFGRVIVLDKLHPQVHATAMRPDALDSAIEFRHADITEPAVWDALMDKVRPDLVVHLAAETGTGQSLTEASRHARDNVLGTTVMLDSFARHGHIPRHIVLASSRAIYGEGAWRRTDGRVFYPGRRSLAQMAEGQWDFPDARPLVSSAATTEPRPTSIYGATKLAQEHVLEAWSEAFGSNLTILRPQNVYGPGQSLINSYTGIVCFFARLASKGESIPLFEDGAMVRDFVYIEDVVTAFLRVIDAAPPGTRRVDIGTGKPVSVRQLSELIAARYAAPAPHVTGQHRAGDVRHAACAPDATLNALGWAPNHDLRSGLDRVCAWVDDQLGAAQDSPVLVAAG